MENNKNRYILSSVIVFLTVIVFSSFGAGFNYTPTIREKSLWSNS